MIPNPGTYRGRLNGQVHLYFAPAGALCAALPVILIGDEWQWTGKHTMTLAKQDGTLQTRTIDTLKKVFRWDGIIENLDPKIFRLEGDELPDQAALDACASFEFELVCIHDTFRPEGSDEEKTTFKVQWLNPVGESGFKMPEAADRKTILAKYGSKFRAISGAKPAAAAPKAKATPAPTPEPEQPELASPAKSAPAKKAPPAAPAKKAPAKSTSVHSRTATMEEAWAGLIKARPDVTDEAQLGEIFYAIIEEVFPGKDNSSMTIQNWGAMLDKVEATTV